MEQYKTTGTEDRLKLFRTLDETCHLEAVRRPTVTRLENIGNTCAIDSVLTALFSHFIELNKEYNHPARRKIAEWVSTIHLHGSISELVPLFRSFPSEDSFHIIGQPKDAVEFLIYFLKIFADDVCSTKVFKTINRGVVTFASIDRKSSPVQYIPANALVGRESVAVQDFLINKNVVGNGDKMTTEEIVQSDLVVFAVGRKMSDGTLVNTMVMPSPSLTTSNGDRFFLGSMVVAENCHYIAYVRDRSTWYMYDDFSPSIREVGCFTDMTKWSPSPITNGVLYFYFPDYSSVDEHVMSMWTSPVRLDIGVFEDAPNDKLINLYSMFETVRVSHSLPTLKKFEKVNGDPCLYIHDAKSFLQLFRG